MNKQQVVDQLLAGQSCQAGQDSGEVFAPTNIALCKYWGKRDATLHLPQNSSLSIALPALGCWTRISVIDAAQDEIWHEAQCLPVESGFAQKISAFLDLFRTREDYHFKVQTRANIPIAAGLASSACGYAALIKALAQLFAWQLSRQDLSILARLGSGSAARSFWSDFVVWHKGLRDDGMDSFAESLSIDWPEFKVALLMVTEAQKPVSSREGMQRTVKTSPLYRIWPTKAEADFMQMQAALQARDFCTVAAMAEQNALLMHATMQNAVPPVDYWQTASVAHMQTVWALRRQALPVYFTMDAGPNIKLLFPAAVLDQVRAAFPTLQLAN